VEAADLDILFEHQLDPEAVRMAAFTSEDPADRGAFDRHWQRLLADEQVVVRTILSDGEVVGHIAAYGPDDQREVTYWVGRDHWGQGSATQALRQMLALVDERPLFARAAADNVGSLIVLKNCGFEEVRREQGYANARDGEIEEVVLTLLP
jgi:RimJ/RimL family protein N-acetyltransferase